MPSSHIAAPVPSSGSTKECRSVQDSTSRWPTPLLLSTRVVIFARRFWVQNVGANAFVHGAASQLWSHGVSGQLAWFVRTQLIALAHRSSTVKTTWPTGGD